MVRRSQRLLTKARDAYYERRYVEAVERCQEALGALLPERPGPPLPAEEQGARFLAAWSAHLPVMEAERIAGVFTFFARRKAQFRHERGAPLPRRDWWRLLQVTRAEADAALHATRIAFEAVKAGLQRP